MEWSGLLWCCDHDKPALVSSYSAGGVYRCKRDYDAARGNICFIIEKRYIDEPLTTEVLLQLDFTPCAAGMRRRWTKQEGEQAQELNKGGTPL